MSPIKKLEIETNIELFRKEFPDDLSCLSVLADLKWKDGYVCSNCGSANYCKGKQPYSRRCTKCKKDESATANTVFHRCKFSLRKAFEIVLLSCQSSAISSYKMSDILDLRHMTCYSFQKKIVECQSNTTNKSYLKGLITEINHRTHHK